MMSLLPLLLLLLLHCPSCVSGQQIACNVKPVPECTCWENIFGQMTVSCNYAGLTAIPDLRRGNQPHVRLYKLELSHNNITAVGERELLGAEVEHLVLSHNQIRHIDSEAFTDMLGSLESLDLSHNELSSIPHFPDSAAKLTLLDLRHNRLRQLPAVFRQLPAGIRHLHVEHNTLDEFQETVDGDFGALPLESLSFGPVAKFSFGNLFVSRNRQLRELRIVDTRIQLNSNSNVLRKMARVQLLELDNCDVFPPSNFKFLFLALAPNLRVLGLRGTGLQEVPPLLYKLSKLTSLDLSHNSISHVSLADVGELKQLEFVDLSNNKLQSVSDYVFAFMDNLRRINLSGNQLQSLALEAFNEARLPAMELLLRDNPWRCDCGIAWLIHEAMEELSGAPGPLKVTEIQYSLQCAKPQQFQGVQFAELAELYYEDFMMECQ